MSPFPKFFLSSLLSHRCPLSSTVLFCCLFYSDLVIRKLIRLKGIKNVKMKEHLTFLSSQREFSTYCSPVHRWKKWCIWRWQRDFHLKEGGYRALSRDAAEHLCVEKSLHLDCSSIFLHLQSFPLKFSIFRYLKNHGISCHFSLVFSVTPTFDFMFCSACSFHRRRCEPDFTRCRKWPQLRKMKTACTFVTMIDCKRY